MEVCRACLAADTRESMICLEEEFIETYNLLTGLSVNLKDGFSQYTCLLCVDTIKSYTLFREKCIISENTLKQIQDENTIEKFDPVDYEIQDVKIKRSKRIKINKEKKISKHLLEEEKEILDNIALKPEIKEECLEEDFECTEEFDHSEFGSWFGKNEDEDIKEESQNRPQKKSSAKKQVNAIKTPIKNGKELACGLCIKVFPKNESEEYIKHIESHKNDGYCQLCKIKLDSWPEYVGHRILHLVKHKKCYLCDKKCVSPYYMEYHYKTEHCGENNITIDCRQCKKSYKNAYRLTRHIRLCHSKREGKIYICDICQKISSSKYNLLAHIRMHNDKKEYVCKLCDFSCKTPQGLRQHQLRRHTKTKTYCRNCTSVFPTQELLDRHKCKQQEAAICPSCGKTYKNKKSMNRHMESHDPVSRYKCTQCPAAYRSPGSLRIHIDRDHRGVRTWKCEYCDRAFFYAAVLIKHRRVHTGEKPYVCKVCSKAFTGRHNLKVHMKVHGEYLVKKKNQEEEPFDFQKT